MIFFCGYAKNKYLCPPIYGDVAQLVEQRTENPCVGGSIPSITTEGSLTAAFFVVLIQLRFTLSNCTS